MIRYPVVLERDTDGYWVHAPDVPGCVSFGASRDGALQSMREAIEGHLLLLREQGVAAPAPGASIATVEVSTDLER
jgi:predicted RNase H-like HicB family nuclease